MSNPIKERDELEKQIAGAWREYNHSTQARQQAEVELAQAKRALADVRVMRPAGRATDKEVVTAEEHVAQAEAACGLYADRADGALDAAKGLEAELDQLLAAHPSEFAEAAEHATQAACRALESAQDALGAAWEAWQQAEAAWLPLCRALRLETVPACPLPKPQQVTDVVPRPRAVVLRE